VLADGRAVRADAADHPDLFWALRGAGGNFGIVTAFEFSAAPVRDVVYSRMVLECGDLAELLARWGEIIENAPRELESFLYSATQRGAPSFVQLTNIYAGDDDRAAVDALTPLLDIGRVLDQEAVRAPYAAVLPAAEGPHSGGRTRRSEPGRLPSTLIGTN